LPGYNAAVMNGGGTFLQTNTRCGNATTVVNINVGTNCGPCFF
jgi:hypothetical protein